MQSPEEHVNIAISESGLLIQYLRSLAPDAWYKPSACPRWEVRDVVAHTPHRRVILDTAMDGVRIEQVEVVRTT